MERIYLDTSVFGGYFELEFELWGKLLFNKIINRDIKLLYSQMTEIELVNAPKKVRDILTKIPNSNIEFLRVNYMQGHKILEIRTPREILEL